jgi:hypothetical protein
LNGLGALMGWIARRHGTYGIWREGKACLPFVFARSAFVGIDGRVCLGRPVLEAYFYSEGLCDTIRHEKKRKLFGCQASKESSRDDVFHTRTFDVFHTSKAV